MTLAAGPRKGCFFNKKLELKGSIQQEFFMGYIIYN